MNILERTVGGVDKWQQRHHIPGISFAIIKKFGDDQAGNLVALLTYYAFIATFPLLLALSGILGIVLKGHPALQVTIQSSALAEFPIIGSQLNSQLGIASLGHSTFALVVGITGSILGGRGLANAFQNAANSVWNVPKMVRPGFPQNFIRSLGLIGLLGIGAVVTAIAASLVGTAQLFGLSGIPIKIFAFAITTALDFALFFATFRIATAKVIATKDLLLGAILSSVAWQILLTFAGVIISRDLKNAQAVAGFFGVVLGLLAWFGLQATLTIYAMEADVVRARHLWPRSIVQPPLTEADKRYLDDAAKAEQRRPEAEVELKFMK